MDIEYYSQNGQDVYLDNLFRQQKHGSFLDIGAFDGIKYSNTFFFEKFRNWTGVCVEPNALIFSDLIKNRNSKLLNFAVGKSDANAKFLRLVDNIMLSGLESEFEGQHLERIKKDIQNHKYVYETVSCISFMDIVQDFFTDGHIDYCSIDVEGGELSILKSIDFNRVHVSVFSIENSYDNEEIISIMCNNNYIYINRIGEDDIFILREEL